MMMMMMMVNTESTNDPQKQRCPTASLYGVTTQGPRPAASSRQ